MAYADELQAVSVDEALIDVTSQVHALATAPPEMDVAVEATRDEGKVPQNADMSTENANASHINGETSDKARQEAPAAVPPEPAIHQTNSDTERPEEAHQPTDWAKVLAEKIRSDVRKATGCEGRPFLICIMTRAEFNS
jgi:cell pole-organizing protein PopZ